MNVLTVPFFIGQPMAGLLAPEPSETLASRLQGPGAYDTSRASAPGDIGQERLGMLYEELAAQIAQREPTLVYAGDCLAVIGVLAGLERKGIRPTLYWFDAHGDFNTWETTGSQFLGGMPLAMITGRGEQTIVEHVKLTPLSDDKVILVDARDLDPEESVLVENSEIGHLSVTQVTDNTPADGPIYVHVDVDVADPEELPAVNYPAPGGPSVDAVRAAVRHLAATGRVVAASVSSWNPELPGAARAAEATRSIMDVFLD